MPPRSQRGGSRPARGNDVCASTLLVQHTEKPTDGAEADARTVTVLLCLVPTRMPQGPPPPGGNSSSLATPPPPPDPGQGYFYATQGAFAGWIGITSTALFLCLLCCCAYLMRWVRRPRRGQPDVEAGQQLALTDGRSMVLGQPCSALPSAELPALYQALTSSSAAWGESADGTVTGRPAQAAVGLPVLPPTQRTIRNPLFAYPRPLFGGALVLEAPPVLPVVRSGPLGFGVAHQGSGFDSLGPRQQ